MLAMPSNWSVSAGAYSRSWPKTRCRSWHHSPRLCPNRSSPRTCGIRRTRRAATLRHGHSKELRERITVGKRAICSVGTRQTRWYLLRARKPRPLKPRGGVPLLQHARGARRVQIVRRDCVNLIASEHPSTSLQAASNPAKLTSTTPNPSRRKPRGRVQIPPSPPCKAPVRSKFSEAKTLICVKSAQDSSRKCSGAARSWLIEPRVSACSEGAAASVTGGTHPSVLTVGSGPAAALRAREGPPSRCACGIPVPEPRLTRCPSPGRQWTGARRRPGSGARSAH